METLDDIEFRQEVHAALERGEKLEHAKKRKQPAKKSPTQRTLQWLRDEGYPLVAVTERWNPHAMIRQDLYGIIDVLAVGKDVLAVQSTSGTSQSNMNARIRKIQDSSALTHLLTAGIRVLVQGWRKGTDGKWKHTEFEF